VKFAFIAKHRGIWPAEWLCGALGAGWLLCLADTATQSTQPERGGVRSEGSRQLPRAHTGEGDHAVRRMETA
jgi:hypothetical protein